MRGLLAAAALLSFAGTNRGLGGAELIAHAFGLTGPEHAQSPHFESTGIGFTHGDHCQLGLSTLLGKLPEQPATPLRGAAIVRCALPIHQVAAAHAPFDTTALPRAPPALHI